MLIGFWTTGPRSLTFVGSTSSLFRFLPDRLFARLTFILEVYLFVLLIISNLSENIFDNDRYYVAEGVRIYSQDSWKMIVGQEGKHIVEKYIKETVSCSIPSWLMAVNLLHIIGLGTIQILFQTKCVQNYPPYPEGGTIVGVDKIPSSESDSIKILIIL